jgi:AraC-like DNA-binding protein
MIKHLAFERYLFRQLTEAGKDTGEIRARLRSLGADRLERLRVLAGYCVAACDDPYLGLTIGQEVTTTAYGVLGHAFIHSETLIQAHLFMLKHLWVMQPAPAHAARLEVSDQHVTLTYLHPPLWPELPDFYLDLFFSANLKRSRELTDGPLTGAYLVRKRAAPEDPARYQQVLGVAVTFGADVDQLVIPRHLAEAPLASAAMGHSRVYLEQCDAILASMRRSSSFAEQVRQVILEQRDSGMSDVAHRLNMSTRTLRRRLEHQGITFRAVQQDVRLHLASQYLTETTLAIADIAPLVGYFDTPTFSRAFRAWTGKTPKVFRDEQSRLLWEKRRRS